MRHSSLGVAAFHSVVRPDPRKRLISASAARLSKLGLGLLAISLAALVPVSVSFAQTVSFSLATNFAAGLNPSSVAIGDLNGDGKPDLAVANVSSGTVSILLGAGAGAFGPATGFAVGFLPFFVTIGDLNGDGKPDLAVANVGSNTVSILLGDGAGAFGPATDSAVGSNPFSIAIGDLNGDGKLDLAVSAGGSVSILLGTGAGAFGPATSFAVGSGTLSGAVSVAIGDFNGDGKPDLAVANLSSNTVSILLGTGAGGFGPATNFPVAGLAASTVAIGDLNGDGVLDLAVANQSSNNVSVLLGTGTGAFGPAANFAVGSQPFSVAIGDLNGDGKPDLAVANIGSNTVSILLGTGAGAFGPATNFVVGSNPISVAIGDLNGDGKPDLAVANQGSNSVSILLNTSASSDAVPPTTIASATPSPNATGWNNSSVTVTLTATDNSGRSGVKSITYAIGSGPATTLNGATTSFAVSAEGVTTITYHAIDNAGNTEANKTLTVRIDRIAPATSASATPAPNAAGWNNTPVTLSLSAADNAGGSGVQSITYIASTSSITTGQTVSGATASVPVSAQGVTTVRYHAADNAGNTEADKIIVVRIDTIAPALALPANITADATSPAGAIVSYAATATDGSGVSPTLTCAPASGSTFPIGTTTVNCTASDAAGNSSSGSFTVTVNGPSAETSNLIALVQSFHLPREIGHELAEKLQKALNGFNAGNPRGVARACRALDSFIREVGKLSGRRLAPAQASQLIAAATRILAAGGCPAGRGERDDDGDEEDR